jgi:photosystem II stability/assembly factor-like uncharacterized protein
MNYSFQSASNMNKATWILLLSMVFVGRSILLGEVVLVQSPSAHVPGILQSEGIQLDAKTAFVTQYGDPPRWFLTKDGGLRWNELRVRSGTKFLGVEDDLTIEQWYSERTIFSVRGVFFSSDNKHRCKASPVRSIKLRGQQGLRILMNAQHKKQLEKTDNGGSGWAGTGTTNLWFDSLQNFDTPSSNVIVALVHVEAAPRGQNNRFARSSDSGKTWRQVFIPEQKLGILASHLFFLNSETGWVASEGDGGLFVTDDGGESWKEVQIPERVICGAFFKDRDKGRVIGGIQGKVYETNNGGKQWRVLMDREVLSDSFSSYFSPKPLARWNDFAVYKTLLCSESTTRK